MSSDWPQISRTETLDAAELSARAARGFLGDICAHADMSPGTTETALLLVSEVVTNAITHGEGRPVIEIDVQPHRMRVSVVDDAASMPEVQPQDLELAEGGRGLFLVDSLATRWGIDRRVPSGKTVWFELDRD